MMKRERYNLEDDKFLRKRKGAKEWEREREVIYR